MMRSIHLNYHEVTKDPRVLKQCESLATRGVDITVVCALEGDAPERQRLGKLDIHRMVWNDTSAVTPSDISGYKSMKRFYPFIESRFNAILEVNDQARTFRDLARRYGKGDLDVLAYRRLKGIRRDLKKVQTLYALNQMKSSAKSDKKLQETHGNQHVDELFSIDYHKKMRNTVKTFALNLFQDSSVLFDINLRHLETVGPADFVHAHDIYTLPAGVNLAKRLGARLIYDAHEYEIERASNMPAEGSAMVDALERDCLEHCDALISVSSTLCDLYAKRFTKRPPVLVMNAPDVSPEALKRGPTEHARADFRHSLGVGADTPLIMYTGFVLREQRGLDKVVEALALLPGFHLVVLGPRHKSDDGWLIEAAKNAGVDRRVHLLDPVPHKQVVPTVSLGDVSVVPFQDATVSYRHAMPNKLFEAVFSGLPVCVANLPDMRQFVETLGRGKAMDQTDPKNISETIAALYDNRSSLKMSDADLASLVRDVGWDTQVDRIEALYLDLLAKKQ